MRIKKADTFPNHALLRSSYTTADVNFMSWDTVYSIFPLAKMRSHRFYLPRRPDDDLGPRLVELEHGWNTRDFVWTDLGEYELRGVGLRQVGNRYSCIMPLNPAIPCPRVTPGRVLELAEFEILDKTTRFVYQTDSIGFTSTTKVINSANTDELSIKVKELSSPALPYRYTTCDDARNNNWCYFTMQLSNDGC